MPFRSSHTLLALALLCSAASSARAADHFLTIGGGSSATNNQVSLEKNILYLQRFLADNGLANAPHEILFADGTGGAPDLQYVDPNAKMPRVNELLAAVLSQDHGLNDQYRAHAIPGLSGPSNRASLNKWFDTTGKSLADGDRLFIYYTGHGGKGSTLAMWNEQDLPAKDFAALLEKLSPKVSVVLVMVQCYSGGFADMIYDGGLATRGLTKRDRCGFFATVSDRLAAGCTSDVDEENYREYSTYFWAALYGQTRMGQPVPAPDYDKDGRVSLAEAHAYNLVNSDTIDISVKTSDALLRKYSKLKSPDPRPKSAAGTATATTAPALMDVEGSLDALLKPAGPAEQAVLTGLARQLDLAPDGPARAARNLAAAQLKKQRDAERDLEAARKKRGGARRAIRGAVLMRWPELVNALHPKSAAILRDEADAIVKLIESHPQFTEMQNGDAEADRLQDEKMAAERKWVKTQRFIRQAEHVAYAANLAAVAPADVVAKYKSMVAAEGGTLGAVMQGRADATTADPLQRAAADGTGTFSVGCDPLRSE